MYAKRTCKIRILFTIFIFCYSAEGPYGTISSKRPFKVIVGQVSDVAPWASCYFTDYSFVLCQLYSYLYSFKHLEVIVISLAMYRYCTKKSMKINDTKKKSNTHPLIYQLKLNYLKVYPWTKRMFL